MIKKKYIAIEGAIGVGKTTLAKKISNTVKCETLFAVSYTHLRAHET